MRGINDRRIETRGKRVNGQRADGEPAVGDDHGGDERSCDALGGDGAGGDSLGSSAGRPVKLCIETELERYFAMLDGQTPAALHKLVIGEAEQALLACVLRHAGGNQSRAAQYLGINRGTLRKKLREYGIDG